MRPKDLIYPFISQKRAPLLQEGVLYLPKLYPYHLVNEPQKMLLPLFQAKEIINIEYGSGNGEWIIEKAALFPNQLWIAVEKRFDRVQKIWSKRENNQLSNLFIVCAEAETFSPYYLPEGLIHKVFVNFPDPWPKKRHAQKRLFQAAFLQELKRVTAPSAVITIVTDYAPYAEQIVASCQKADLVSSFPAPYFIQHWEDYGDSYFKQLWEMQEKSLHFMQFIKP